MPHQGRGLYDTFIEGPANPSSARGFAASVTPGYACVSSVCLLPQDWRMLGLLAYEIPTDSESRHKARYSHPFGCWHGCRLSMLILIT